MNTVTAKIGSTRGNKEVAQDGQEEWDKCFKAWHANKRKVANKAAAAMGQAPSELAREHRL